MNSSTRNSLLAVAAVMAIAANAKAEDPCFKDMNSYVETQRGLIGNKGNNRYIQTITVQNKSIYDLTGTFWLVFQALPQNVTVENPTGLTRCGQSSNTHPKPFIQFSAGRDGVLHKWESVQVHVEYYAPSMQAMDHYQLVVFAGPNLKRMTVHGDYDGDSRADLAVFRNSAKEIVIRRSSDKQSVQVQTPYDAQHLIVGDFDGDGKADPAALLMPGRSFWTKLSSSNIEWTMPALTQNKMHLMCADYDGDGITDFGVYDKVAKKFRYHSSKYKMPMAPAFAMDDNAVPAVADYDDDGKADIGSFNHLTGEYKYVGSKWNQTVIKNVANPNNLWLVPMPGNFNGDDWADPTVYAMQKGFWFMQLSGGINVSYAGPSGLPLPYDWDGDGRTDRGIWQSQANTLKVVLSSGAPFADVLFGQQGDQGPMPSYVLFP